MFVLYRSDSYPAQWIVRVSGDEWFAFPAKLDGWKDARHPIVRPPVDLMRVPLWLAFNTGLLEAADEKRRRSAA